MFAAATNGDTRRTDNFAAAVEPSETSAAAAAAAAVAVAVAVAMRVSVAVAVHGILALERFCTLHFGARACFCAHIFVRTRAVARLRLKFAFYNRPKTRRASTERAIGTNQMMIVAATAAKICIKMFYRSLLSFFFAGVPRAFAFARR